LPGLWSAGLFQNLYRAQRLQSARGGVPLFLIFLLDQRFQPTAKVEVRLMLERLAACRNG
jgi:hypothetical protein